MKVAQVFEYNLFMNSRLKSWKFLRAKLGLFSLSVMISFSYCKLPRNLLQTFCKLPTNFLETYVLELQVLRRWKIILFKARRRDFARHRYDAHPDNFLISGSTHILWNWKSCWNWNYIVSSFIYGYLYSVFK